MQHVFLKLLSLLAEVDMCFLKSVLCIDFHTEGVFFAFTLAFELAAFPIMNS